MIAYLLSISLLLAGVSEPKPERYALLVGCTEYPALLDKHGKTLYEQRIRLLGSKNDVELIGETLRDVLGYPEKNIVELAGWPEDESKRPTHDNIVAAFESLAKKAKPGDTVFILLAGHGTQVRDASKGDELDGYDEVFLPADVTLYESKRGIPNSLTDDAIREHVRRFTAKGAFVWIAMDCCHAGTMVRGADDGIRLRSLRPKLLGAPDADAGDDAPETRGEGDLTPARDAGYIAMYAVQSFHKTPEMQLPRGSKNSRQQGLFSFMLARELTRSRGRLTFGDLHGRILGSYQTLPFEGAVPLAEGDLRRRVDGATGAERGLAPLRVNMGVGGEVTLNAGEIWGISVGDRVAVQDTDDPDGAVIGFAEVTSVGAASSRCRLIGRDDGPPPRLRRRIPYPARIATTVAFDHQLRVCLVDAVGEPLHRDETPADVVAFFEGCGNHIAWVATARNADWLLTISRLRGMWLQPIYSGGGSERFVVANVAELDRALHDIFRIRNLRRLLVADIDPLPGGIEVEVFVDRRSRRHRVRPGEILRPGESVTVVTSNRTGRIFDVTILHVNAHYGVQTIRPLRGETARLFPRDRKGTQVRWNVTDDGLGLEHLLVIAVPRKESDDEVRFDWLDRPRLSLKTRGALDHDPFTERLKTLGFGHKTRGLSKAKTNYSPTGTMITWQSAWPRLVAPTFGAHTAELPRARSLPVDTEIPEAWSDLGTKASRRSSIGGGPLDVLLVGDAEPSHVFIDLDGDDGQRLQDTKQLPQLLTAQKKFDAEIAVRFAKGKTIVFYDTDETPGFDLIYENNDTDPETDVMYVREQDSWRIDKQTDVPLLCSVNFGEDRADDWNIVSKLRFLAP